jgi:peptidoglycan/LPS O-acetylase OafA/YrhL
MRLRDCLDRASNNFDLLRLFAACMVIVGHAHALVPAASGPDWVQAAIGFDYAGSLAVKFFFFLSGLVVTNSLLNARAPLGFVVARFARIVPGLVVCVVLTAFVLGPLVTRSPLGAYFHDPLTAHYVTRNIGLALQWDLPGVFDANPRHGVNGSLWTLPIEVFCYLSLLALGLVGVLRGQVVGTAVLVGVIAYAVMTPRYLFQFGLPDGESQLLPALFAAGGLLALHRGRFKISVPAWVGLALLAYLLRGTGLFQYSFYAALFYGALVFGTSRAVCRVRLPGDFSYGVYLDGWPIQQSLVWLRPDWSVPRHQAVAIGLSLVAGALSWFLVERPAIRFGRFICAGCGCATFLVTRAGTRVAAIVSALGQVGVAGSSALDRRRYKTLFRPEASRSGSQIV